MLAEVFLTMVFLLPVTIVIPFLRSRYGSSGDGSLSRTACITRVSGLGS